MKLTYAVPVEVTDTNVPDTSGMTYSQAANALGAQTLNAQPGTDEYSDTVPAGQVIRTEPASGTTVPEGTVVTVIVSLGPDPNAGGGGGGNGGGGG